MGWAILSMKIKFGKILPGKCCPPVWVGEILRWFLPNAFCQITAQRWAWAICTQAGNYSYLCFGMAQPREEIIA